MTTPAHLLELIYMSPAAKKTKPEKETGLNDLLAYAEERPDIAAYKPALEAYRARYGSRD